MSSSPKRGNEGGRKTGEETNPFEAQEEGGVSAGDIYNGMKSGVSKVTGKVTRTITNIPKTRLLYLMKAANILNGLLLIAAAVCGFFAVTGLTAIFLAVYIGIAGVLLLGFELKAGKRLKKFVRSQCGFMYTYSGRLMFLIL